MKVYNLFNIIITFTPVNSKTFLVLKIKCDEGVITNILLGTACDLWGVIIQVNNNFEIITINASDERLSRIRYNFNKSFELKMCSWKRGFLSYLW